MDTYTIIYYVWVVLSFLVLLGERIAQVKQNAHRRFIFILLNVVLMFLFLVFGVLPRAGLSVVEGLLPIFLVVLVAVAVTMFHLHRRRNGQNQ